MSQKYRYDIDLLKGIAIIAVVLYHMGICKSGYLGVDVFFVISGFLVSPKMVSEIMEGKFHYLSFMKRRIQRLLPLVIVVAALSLLIGRTVGMFPEDYKRLCESVIASDFMSQNILSAVTDKDYWSAINDYKPLMHLWYVGILFEFYLVMPILLYGGKAIKARMGGGKYSIEIFLIVLSGISLVLYFIPGITDGDRFYYLPFRLYELIFGGLIGLSIASKKDANKINKGFYITAVLLLIAFVYLGTVSVGERSINDIDIVSGLYVGTKSILPKSLVLVIVVLLTCCCLNLNRCHSAKGLRVVEILGKMSYSIFIWHQFLLAFYRYYYSSNITSTFVFLFVLLCGTLSWFTYKYVERIKFENVKASAVLATVFVTTLVFAYSGYASAGIVEDVPELEVSRKDARKAMFAEYVDRVYGYDRDFPSDHQKIKVMVIGNSFSRDWVNLLLESKYKDSIYISYIEGFKDNNRKRIHESDVIFFFGYKHSLPEWFWNEKRSEVKVWGIGTKNYGVCNGVIYKNRNKKWYHRQTVDYNPNYDIVNTNLKKEWNDTYIDLIETHKNKEGKIPAFTPDNKYISPDCRHWTRAGAAYFSSIVDLDAMFGNLRPQ